LRSSIEAKRLDRCSVGLADFEYVVDHGLHKSSRRTDLAGPIIAP
jgi:hypothetical protein